jgi:hypothetical protein
MCTLLQGAYEFTKTLLSRPADRKGSQTTRPQSLGFTLLLFVPPFIIVNAPAPFALLMNSMLAFGFERTPDQPLNEVIERTLNLARWIVNNTRIAVASADSEAKPT